MLGRVSRSMVAALLVVRLFDETAAFLPYGALESFRDDLDLTYAQTGMVLAAIGPGGLAGNGAAIAADFISRRVIVVGGALVYAASMLAFAVGDSFVVLLAGGFLLGLGSTAMVDGAEVALTDVAGDRLRVLLSRANLAAYAGDLLGPAILIVVAATGLSWRVAFAAVAGLLVAYAGALAVRPLPAPERAPDAPRPAGAVLAALRDPQVWVLALLSLLMSPLDEAIVGFGIAFLETERGLSTAVATVAGIAVTAGGIGALLAARRLEQRDDRRLLVAAGVGMAASVVAFALLPGVAALLPLVALGASTAVAWLALQHRTLTLRPGAAGTTKAVITTIDTAALALPVLIGAIADRWGLGAGIAVFAVLPSAFALVASRASSS